MTELCVLADGECDHFPKGSPELHHVIPQQTIRGQYRYWNGLMPQMRVLRELPPEMPPLEEALADRRNLVPLCRHHHERVTNHRMYVTADLWPEGIMDFADSIGCRWWLERWANG